MVKKSVRPFSYLEAKSIQFISNKQTSSLVPCDIIKMSLVDIKQQNILFRPSDSIVFCIIFSTLTVFGFVSLPQGKKSEVNIVLIP